MIGIKISYDIFFLKNGIDRKDDIGKEAVMLHPWMLDYKTFYAGIPPCLHHEVSAVPVAYPAWMVAPHHVKSGPALFLRNRIGVFYKLVFYLPLD